MKYNVVNTTKGEKEKITEYGFCVVEFDGDQNELSIVPEGWEMIVRFQDMKIKHLNHTWIILESEREQVTLYFR